MCCTIEHSEIKHILQQLPLSQGGTGLNKCVGCAFEEGYNDGLSGINRDVNDVVASLPESSVEELQQKCPITAYAIGFEIGSKVACRKVEIASFNASMQLPSPRKTSNIKNWKKLAIYPINNTFIVGVFQGAISDWDMIVKYWKYNTKSHRWEKPFQPKHVHWVVDMLIKQEFSKAEIHKFIEKLIDDWDTPGVVPSLQSQKEQADFLDEEKLYRFAYIEEKRYPLIEQRGEYPLSLLILLARILMVQERTNMPRAFMFRKLLRYMDEEDFYRTINTATHNGR